MATRGHSRIPSHQLSSGLYVSGRREQQKEKMVMASAPSPYTGGDIKKSGELGKMFDLPVEDPKSKKSGPARTGNIGNISSSSPSQLGSGSGSIPPRSVYSTSGPLNSGGIPRQFTASGAQNRSGPLSGNILSGSSNQAASNSGPLPKSGESGNIASMPNTSSFKSSGPLSSGGGTPSAVARQNSGSLLPATGLITSGPISSGPLSSSGAQKKRVSGPLDSSGAPLKFVSATATNPAVNKLVREAAFTKGIPKVILWTVAILFVVGFIAGGFIFATVRNPILLAVVGGLCVAVVLFLTWNSCRGGKSIKHFLASYDDADLRHAKDGQYVKVTGVVTCGSVPLESSYQKVSRCIYTSTGVYEYRGLKSKQAKKGHRRFTWGLRYSERHVADFYISDFQSGLRALVKAGYTAAVFPYVEESTVVDMSLKKNDVPNNLVRWLGERNLSIDDRMMRIKEGYIKEGVTVTVMGVVQRHDNILTIAPPREPISTGCQWKSLLLPRTMDGLIVYCEETCQVDGIPL